MAGLYSGSARKKRRPFETQDRQAAALPKKRTGASVWSALRFFFLLNTASLKLKLVLAGGACADAHAVEGAVDEDKRDDEKRRGENVR